MEPKKTASGRQGVTYEQAAAAADALVAAGERPTIRAVRARLGGGSPNTIQRHLEEWNQGRTLAVQSATTLPAEIQRLILAEMGREAAAVRAELQQELADARTNNEELARENDEQAQQIESLAAAFAQAQADLERRNGAIEQFEQSLAAARETAERERQGAEAARQALAKAELKLDALPRLERELEAVRGAYVERTRELDDCTTRRAACEAKLAAHLEAITDLKTRLAAAEKALADERELANQARSDAARLDSELASARSALAAANAATAQARQDLADEKAISSELHRQILEIARGKGGDKPPRPKAS